MRKKQTITANEVKELFELGWCIHANYQGPLEGMEYWFMPVGKWDDAHFGGKSERAAYNRCKKYIQLQSLMEE